MSTSFYYGSVRVAIDARKWRDFGIGRYIRGLVNELARLDGEERYVAIGPRQIESELPTGFAFVENDSPHYSAREIWSVGRSVTASRADVLHEPHYVLPRVAVPSVVTIHDLTHLDLFTAARDAHRRAYAWIMLKRATTAARIILTVSESAATAIAKSFPDARPKLRVTPNGIDDLFFRGRQPGDDAILERHGVESDRYFLFVGNDKPHKNVQTLLGAFHSLPSPRPTLLLAGNSRAGGERVRSCGVVPDGDLRALYAHSLALILPSRYEGFGLPVAEAMAAGAPVIASNIAVLREVAGGAAIHVAVDDAAALRDAMELVAGEAELRDELRARGAERACAFTWRRTAELTRDAYREAMKD